MAALGKGISRSAGVRWHRGGALAAVLFAAALLAGNAGPARASQDPLFSAQWALQEIGAPTAWQRSTGAGVRIGIVDSGVFAAQEDLVGKVVAATDCINTEGDPRACHGSGVDDTGHGTHMAGIAAATKDNGRGIAGVAPDARLVVARVLTDNGGSITDVEAGIRWVVQHGAQVVNLSLGDNPIAQRPIDLSFEAAVEEAWAAGAVPVVTSGNTTAVGPARESFASLDALVVGATDFRGVVMPYSNPLSSAKWGLVAPGGSGTRDGRDVLSTWRDPSAPSATNRYSYGAGTSVAAAHTSGVVALLLAEGLSPMEAVQRIIDTARPVQCGTSCHGLLDAAAAVAPAPGRVVVNSIGRPTPATRAQLPVHPSSTQGSAVPTTMSASTDLPPPPEIALGVPDAPIRGRVIASSARSTVDRASKVGWTLVAIAPGAAIFLLVARRYPDGAS